MNLLGELWRRYYWISFMLSVLLLLGGCAATAQGARDGAAAAATGNQPPVVYNPPHVTVNIPPAPVPPPASPGTWDYIGYAVASLAAYAAGSLVKGGVRSVMPGKKNV